MFKKTFLFALVLAVVLASLPVLSVSAAGLNDPTPPPQGELTNERLEKAWARQLRIYEHMGNVEEYIERAQNLISLAQANGKDVSELQTTLDAFEAAVKDAKPIYESMHGLVNSHQGFDENGNVTDPEKAKETVQAMREKFQEIKTAMNGTGRALLEAIGDFREANPRPTPTVTP